MIDTEKITSIKKDNNLHFIKIDFNNFVKDNLKVMTKQLKNWQNKKDSDNFTDDLGITRKGVLIIDCDNYSTKPNALGIKDDNQVSKNGDTIKAWAKRILGQYLLWLERNLTMQKSCHDLITLEHLFDGKYYIRLFTAKDYCDWVFKQLQLGVTNELVFNINVLYLSKLSSQDITKHLLALPNLGQLLVNRFFFHLMSALALEFQRPNNSAATPEQKKLMQKFIAVNQKINNAKLKDAQSLLDYKLETNTLELFIERINTELYAIINCQ